MVDCHSKRRCLNSAPLTDRNRKMEGVEMIPLISVKGFCKHCKEGLCIITPSPNNLKSSPQAPPWQTVSLTCGPSGDIHQQNHKGYYVVPSEKLPCVLSFFFPSEIPLPHNTELWSTLCGSCAHLCSCVIFLYCGIPFLCLSWPTFSIPILFPLVFNFLLNLSNF